MIRIVPAALIVLQLGCCPSDAQVATTGSTAMSLPTVPGAVVISPLNSPGPFSATTEPGAPDTTLAPVPLASNDDAGYGCCLRAAVEFSGIGAGDTGRVEHGPADAGQCGSSTSGHGADQQLHGDNSCGCARGSGNDSHLQFNAWRADDECCVSAALDPASAGQSGAWDDPGGHQRGRRHWH
ncbi:hypothetical protein [Bradyrhizobium genomosp. III]|uniref:hypothetical protein n=1 Tax=Bradyrhizobium genomosp. III TaxID=2683271 RepID=UPI0005778F42|nr:hypothetical protein [Bradyrhizobium sp. CCBAU 15635]